MTKLPARIMPKMSDQDMSPRAQQTLAKTLDRVTGAVNSVSFGGPSSGSGNIDGRWVSVVSPAGPDTEFVVAHNLGRIPSGYKVMRQNKAAVTYDGVTSWTNTQMYLKCNVATVSLTIFVF